VAVTATSELPSGDSNKRCRSRRLERRPVSEALRACS
jgi:hypothetical protein